MKLLKVITILSSLVFLTNCSSTTGSTNNFKPSDTNGLMAEMPAPVFFGDHVEYSMPQFLWRSTQYLRFRLNKDEKKMHQSAVFFMLENAKNGEIVSWYSDKRLANGKVRVIKSYPISGGFCRTYQAYIKLNGADRHTTNNACLYLGSPTWSFYK